MKNKALFASMLPVVASLALSTPAWALSNPQVGPSGKTYASGAFQCALHPVVGFSPMIQAGLYNPNKNDKGKDLLNGQDYASLTYLNPDATVWLINGNNLVGVKLNSLLDTYNFDATASGVPNICIPDTSHNTISADLEYAASNKSYATKTPGCAVNPKTGQAQPFANLFDNGSYLLNVSADGVPLTQLNGTTRRSTPVFLSAGLNVISAANGTLSTDYYVRDGGPGSCTLP